MTHKQFSPANKDSLTVHQTDWSSGSVVQEFLTTAAGWKTRDLEQTIVGNVAGILEA